MSKKTNILLLFSSLGCLLLAVTFGQTTAYFSDTENSESNVFSAGTLDISLDPGGVYTSSLLYPGDSALTSITILNTGTLGAKYASEIDPLTPDTDPCNYVSLSATDGTQSYSGSLLSFISTPSLLASPLAWSYTFTIDSLAPPAVWNKTCYFKWIFTAWGENFADASLGFSDTEEKSGGVKIGKTIVLNEILADPAGPDNAPMPGGEWVELYNNSNIAFDVNGWVLYDSDDSHELYITPSNTNTGNTIVPAHGFLVVYRDGDADFTINNSNETIRLYNGYPVSASVLIDSFSWTTAKPTGFSFARIPDGVGDWVDPIPTPGGPNVLTIVNALPPIEEPPVIETPVIEETEPAIDQPVVEEQAPAEEFLAEEPPAEELVIEQQPVVEPELVIVPAPESNNQESNNQDTGEMPVE